jgi:hypothetical protein
LHHYVNQRCGYTILGYTQLGESIDVSDELLKVDSLHPTIHLVYVHPTNLDSSLTQEYKALMFTLTNDYKKASMPLNPPTSPTVQAQSHTTTITTASSRTTKAGASLNINQTANKRSPPST